MAFEVFEGGGAGRSRNQRAVTVDKNGNIRFSTLLAEELKAEKMDGVVLLFDRTKRIAGIVLTNDSKQKGFCNLRVNENGCRISARVFIKDYGIDNSVTRSYPVEITKWKGQGKNQDMVTFNPIVEGEA